MKLIVQAQLLPDMPTVVRLKATVERFNSACNWIAGECFERKEANVFEARKFAYHATRERFGLSSQMAQLAIKVVCDAYKRDRAIRPVFRKHASVPYDQRTMGFKGIDRVSLLTLEGRAIVPMIVGSYHAGRMALKKGQSDLVLRRDGKWFLLVTVDVPEGTPIPATDFIGVDLGIANIATDSDGNAHSGKAVEVIRRKHNLQRRRLQKRGTKGARKKLKRVAGKEARFKAHENHVIAKAIVESARRTGRGVAREDLTHIRDRITARGGEARNRLGGWAFAQLASFLDYKAKLAGVPTVLVDPRNTSRACSACGHCEKANRKSQGEFSCKACGMSVNADWNAALNLRLRALARSNVAKGLASLRA